MAPQTSTQATVIDLMVRKIQGIGMVVNGQPVMVYDGPEGPDNEDSFVVVMCDDDDPGSSGTQEIAALGSRARYEHYDIIVGAFCFVGGDDGNGADDASDAQAQARTNAGTIEAAIEAAWLADMNLATQNNGVAPVIYLTLEGSNLTQLPPDEESGMGRYVGWRMRFHVYNRLSGG